MRELMSAVLASIFFLEPCVSAKGSAAAQENPPEKAAMMQKVSDFPPGSLVEVRLKSQEKLRGRLGERSNNAFELQVLSGNKVENRSINYEEVKGIKSIEGHGHGFRHGLAMTGLVIGGVIVVAALVLAGGYAALTD